jgi:hypothetical protein
MKRPVCGDQRCSDLIVRNFKVVGKLVSVENDNGFTPTFALAVEAGCLKQAHGTLCVA